MSVHLLWHKRHDYFNLLLIPLVIITNLNYLFSHDDPIAEDKKTFKAFTGKGYRLNQINKAKSVSHEKLKRHTHQVTEKNCYTNSSRVSGSSAAIEGKYLKENANILGISSSNQKSSLKIRDNEIIDLT